MPPTMKDIAKAAGVSQPAVSAVLNNRGNCRVSPETRSRILRIAEELDYHPNQAARLLRGQKSNTVAIFTSLNVSSFQNETLQQISLKLQKQKLTSFLVAARDNEDLRERYLELLSRSIDALICFHIDFDFDRSILKLPQVHVGVEVRDTPDITQDLKNGGAFLAAHLLEHGHEKFVFLTDKLSSNASKYEGVRECLASSGKNTSLEVLEFFHDTGIVTKILKAVSSGATAFICTNDHIASRLCKVLKQHNIKVPEEIAVTGFDGMAFTEYMTPSITTMRGDPEKIAQATVELLLARMKDPMLSASIKIPVSFHCGESCGCKIKQEDKFFFETMPAVITPQKQQEKSL